MVKLRKKGITLLKIAVSIVLLYFIFTKIEFREVLDILKRSNPYFLLASVVFFILSKVIAAFRLNSYFHQLKIVLTQKSNLKLYLLGMFYNLFLPGGIGGDAYKGYVIKKKFGVATKKIVSILVLDRLSGLLMLFIFACLLAFAVNQVEIQQYRILLVVAIFVGFLVFWGLNRKFFNYVYPVFWNSIAYSTLVQFAQLLSVLCILKALELDSNVWAYLFIFLISSIVSVLPLTIGGIGSREVVFFYGALWLGLDENAAVSISMVFFLITALVSLLGAGYHFKNPDLDVLESEEPNLK